MAGSSLAAIPYRNLKTALVSIPPSPGLDLSAGMTLSAWVYPMSRMTGWRLVISKEIMHTSSQPVQMRAL